MPELNTITSAMSQPVPPPPVPPVPGVIPANSSPVTLPGMGATTPAATGMPVVAPRPTMPVPPLVTSAGAPTSVAASSLPAQPIGGAVPTGTSATSAPATLPIPTPPSAVPAATSAPGQVALDQAAALIQPAVTGTTDPLSVKQEPPKDSFGRPIMPEDLAAKPDGAAIPQFVNGVLATPPAPSIAQPEESAVKLEQKTEAKKGKTPMTATVAIYLGVAALVALGIFMLWSTLNQQIVKLKADLVATQDQLSTKSRQLTSCLDENIVNASKEQVVYVSADGSYSFYQNIPSLLVSVDDSNQMVTLNYGDVEDGVPTDGFVAEITNGTTGRGLLALAEEEMGAVEDGHQKYDLLEEEIADNRGYSFVDFDGISEKIVFYLAPTADNVTGYVRFAYVMSNSSNINDYKQVVDQILKSIKIYKRK